ncbi:MAG TPA: peptidoglycan-binding domain-containing protein [Pyrinomonadaceae bacterium]|nr:peptidoglycan-binding domain-containing protein [Pyrinomonadaceae bacterium]
MDVNTLLPASGVGFVTNNRGPGGKFQFGQKSTIDAAKAVGTAWNEAHADRPFSIGQISLKGGGEMPPHKSHRVGLDVDVRPMRTDGANEPVNITDSKYDRATTTELIALWWKKAPVQALFFNDPTVIAAGLSQFVNGHHHHFHARLRARGATIRIGDRGSDVAEVQAKLGLEPDSRFGSVTQDAVEQFQINHGLDPDGVVGPDTWEALGIL